MKLDVKVFDNNIPARCNILKDVVSIEFTTAALGGYIDANIALLRKAGIPYLDVAFNYHLQICDKSGVVVWEGRIHALPQQNSLNGTFSIQAVGYYANLADLTSIWLPYYPSLTDLATIILEGINGTVARNGFLSMAAGAPSLVANSTTVPATGTTIVYTPDNASSVRQHLDELVSKYGNNTYATMYWQVWNDRKFYLSARPTSASPVYSSYLNQAESYQMGLSADGFFNRVSVKYKTYYDSLVTTRDNTSMQVKYGSSFGTNDPAFTRVPLIKEAAVVDITSHGQVDVSQANVVGDTLLARYSNEGIRVLASTITYSNPNAITLESGKQTCPLYLVKAGNMLLSRDVSGANPLVSGYQSTTFIGQTKYTLNGNTEMLELQSEDTQSMDNLLSALLINLDNQLAA